jgi:3-oxoacyl-[acyl-carrier protein] reductase
MLISSGITRVTGFSDKEIAYGSAKAALTHYGAQLAQVLGPQGVRVNVVSPGSIDFEGGLWDQVHKADAAFYEREERGHGSGGQRVAMVVFVASPRAAFLSPEPA